MEVVKGMNISNNPPVKDNPPASSNTFAQQNPPQSSNAFAKDSPDKAPAQWGGDNTSAGEYDFEDMYSGEAYGNEKEYGGLRHFVLRQKVNVSH